MHIKYFLIGYMFLFIYRPFEVYPILGYIHLERLWMFATLGYYFFSKTIQKNKIHGIVPVISFFCVMLLTVVVSEDIDAWYKTVEGYFKYLVFYFVLASSVTDEEEFINIVYAYIAIMFIYEAKSLYEYFVHGRHVFRMGIRRLIGIDKSGGDPNTFAASIVYSLPFAYALYQRLKGGDDVKWNMRLLIAFGAVSIICIVMTGSRAGFVSLALCASLFWFRSHNKLKSLIVICIVAAVTWNFMPQEKKVRIETIIDPEAMLEGPEAEKFRKSAEESAESRGKGFRDGYQLLMKSPVLGFGAGSFKMARGKVGDDAAMQAHNMYGQLMGELGVLGVLAFLVYLGKVISMNMTILRHSELNLASFAEACVMGIILLLFNGYAAHNLYRFNWLWIAAFTSILYCMLNAQFATRRVATQ